MKRVIIPNSSSGFVYKLILNNTVVYVGQTVNIKKRIAAHKSDPGMRFDEYEYFECRQCDMSVIESAIISKYSPVMNNGEVHAAAQKANRMIDTGFGVKIVCANCGDIFYGKTSWSKFCCDSCRVSSHIKKRDSLGLPVSKFVRSVAEYSK